MFWLPITLLSRFFIATTNIASSHFRTYFKAGYAQQFYDSLYAIMFIPILFFLIHPILPSIQTFGWLALAGVLTSLYCVPYFQALKVADSSVVAGLFVFSRAFTPFIAYFIIDEKMSSLEWVGFLITLPGGFLATYSPELKSKFNFKALGLMLLASLGLALSMVIGKLAFSTISGLDGFFYIYLCSMITTWLFIVIPGCRAAIKQGIRPDAKVAV